jgi:hypothetical protein
MVMVMETSWEELDPIIWLRTDAIEWCYISDVVGALKFVRNLSRLRYVKNKSGLEEAQSHFDQAA